MLAAISNSNFCSSHTGTFKLRPMIDSVSNVAGAAPDLKKTKRQKSSSRDASQSVDRLPPHSPEMERGVLGCVLLSPNECMGECIEKLKDNGKESFYDLRHQTIFET